MCLFDNDIVKCHIRWNCYARYEILPEFRKDTRTDDYPDSGKSIPKG